MVGEQLVADIVEVADQRHVDARPVEPLADVRHGRRGLVAVDGDAHDLRAGAGQRRDLRDRRVDIGRVGVGHRLDDDRRAAADDDAADPHGDARAGAGAGARRLRQAGQRRLTRRPQAGRRRAAMRAAAGDLDHLRLRLEALGRQEPGQRPPERRRGQLVDAAAFSQIRNATRSCGACWCGQAIKALRLQGGGRGPLDQESSAR